MPPLAKTDDRDPIRAERDAFLYIYIKKILIIFSSFSQQIERLAVSTLRGCDGSAGKHVSGK